MPARHGDGIAAAISEVMQPSENDLYLSPRIALDLLEGPPLVESLGPFLAGLEDGPDVATIALAIVGRPRASA